MNNTVIFENPKRKKLKTGIAVLLIYVLIFAVSLIFLKLINDKTYNGRTTEVTGTVEKVEIDGDSSATLKLEQYDTTYNVSPVYQQYDKLAELNGKDVVLFVAKDQFGNGNPFVFGLSIDGQNVVDAEKTVSDIRHGNHIAIVVVATLLAVCAAGVCALYIWRLYTAPEKQFPLAEKYVEFYAAKQPSCPQKSIMRLFVFILSCVLLAIVATTSILNAAMDVSTTANVVLTCVLVAVAAGGATTAILLKKWINKKDIEFYEQNFPFDFSDLSHMRMKKELRLQIEMEIKLDYLEHPNDFGDGGNGYLVRFTETGVDLYVPVFDEDGGSAFPDETQVPAEEIFDTGAATLQPEPQVAPVYSLTYQMLNFEAVPICNKFHPLFVVVKSRLTPNADFPEELINDLHFILDVNLLKTLRNFSVPVENLDNVLQNKLQIMLDGQKRKK